MEKLITCKDSCSKLVEEKTKWRSKEVTVEGAVTPTIEKWPDSKWRKTKINPNPNNQNQKIQTKADVFNASGEILDAETGNPYSDSGKFEVNAKFIKDLTKKTFKAEFSGNKFVFYGLEAGGYEINVTRDGYISGTKRVQLTKVTALHEDLMNIMISKELGANVYRAVLNWDGVPKDVDASLYMGKELIDIQHKKSHDGVTQMNVVSKKGLHFEVFTFKERPNEKIFFWVKNSSNDKPFTESGAIVTIYKENKVHKQITAPKNGAGVYWNVFELSSGEVSLINLYKNVINNSI